MFGIADKRLGSKPWTLGDAYSIADIHLFRLYWRIAKFLNLGPQKFPKLAGRYDRMMARPAVKKTIEIETAVGYELPNLLDAR